jgi:hypothetical protein
MIIILLIVLHNQLKAKSYYFDFNNYDISKSDLAVKLIIHMNIKVILDS